MSSETNFIKEINPAVESEITSVRDLKYAILLAFGCFVILFPFYRSRKSMWDAVAASNIIGFLRIFIYIEVLAGLLLLYFTISMGSPLTLHQFTSYGNGDSWIYGYGRPLFGIFTIGVGSMGDMHPLPRIVCLLGTLVQIVMDGLSAFQVGELITQADKLSAPTGLYSPVALQIYYYRDISSCGVNVYILLLNLLFICVVGIANPPFITYQLIAGGDFDRCEVMRHQRVKEQPFKLRKNQLISKYDKYQEDLKGKISEKREFLESMTYFKQIDGENPPKDLEEGLGLGVDDIEEKDENTNAEIA